jgi:predicted Zn-ribbon and HTH transcriptional regulator
MTEENNQECTKCGYEWTPRTENPKACPRCKSRMDWKTGEEK